MRGSFQLALLTKIKNITASVNNILNKISIVDNTIDDLKDKDDVLYNHISNIWNILNMNIYSTGEQIGIDPSNTTAVKIIAALKNRSILFDYINSTRYKNIFPAETGIFIAVKIIANRTALIFIASSGYPIFLMTMSQGVPQGIWRQVTTTVIT